MKIVSTQLKTITAGLVIALLAGCTWFKKKDVETTKAGSEAASSGASLCSINGEPVISESEFLNNLNQMIQANPYFRGASADTLPKELQRKFFEQLTMQAVIEKYSVKNNVEKDPEYIKAYNETEKLLKRSLMVQIFEKHIYDGLSIPDAEISKYFDENKSRFVKVAGGVLAMGARFESDAEASSFLGSIKGNLDEFEKEAKATKAAKFRDFGRVSKEVRGMQYDVVPAPIKDAVLGMSKLPGIEKIKSGGEYWVVKAWDKKDTVLFEMAEVKSHIEGILKNNKFKDALEKRMKDLKGEFKVVVNEEYFKEKNAAPAGAADVAENADTAADGAEVVQDAAPSVASAA